MTTEEKELLLKDLCARLPYRVMAYASEINKNGIITDVNIPYNMVNLTVDNADGKYELVPLFDIKPYLRPMSSMTEEEKKELKSATCPEGTGYFDEQYLICPMSHFGEQISYNFMSDILNWLLSHHFDFRGLIKKGLALEAPEDMYKQK